MKIHRVNAGRTEYLARAPLDVLGEDGVTVDHVETAWTEDEAAAYDFPRVTHAPHARSIAAQIARAGVAATFPPEWVALPEPGPPPAPPARTPARVERHDTPEGIALRERLAAERGAAAKVPQ